MALYFHDIPLETAKQIFENALHAAGKWSLLETEYIHLNECALGRVLAEPIWAKISSPHYHASAMDGFAVRAVDTQGASETKSITLAYGESALYVDTGDAMPPWANAVIPIENVDTLDADMEVIPNNRKPSSIRIRAAIPPWQNVRPMGEDIVATQLVLPAGQVIRPVDLGVIAASGHCMIPAIRQPRVAIIPTGSELVPVGKSVKEGEIIEFNSIILASQVISWSGLAHRFEIVPDNFDLIRKKVEEAANDHDLILINAGSSAGSEDFTAKVVHTLGDLLVHGVAIRPGHPVVLGMINKNAKRTGDMQQKIPIIGVPGYPVSATLTGEIFVKPLIYRWLGIREESQPFIKATLTRKVTSPAGDDDFMRVAIGRVGEKVLAVPLARGAGVITSLSKADGIAILPRGVQGLSAGETIDVQIYCSIDDIERTIFCIGSHDITLDLLSQYLSIYNRRLTSGNVGSLGGLIAIRQGEAHIAGVHLLDPVSGVYNFTYVRQYLEGIPVKLITFVGREQGLLVKKGNPKKISSLKDLQRKDVHFINRQRGSGTRILLDYQLGLLGIDTSSIAGYDQEEYTHLAVAAAVESGRATCSLGITAAAAALNLDFIPLFRERYDLVIPKVHYQSELLQPLLRLLSDKKFQEAVSNLPGYDISQMGEVVANF